MNHFVLFPLLYTFFIQKQCQSFHPDDFFSDLKPGCTGAIVEGDLVVKGWAEHDPSIPLHARCAKMEWGKKVT